MKMCFNIVLFHVKLSMGNKRFIVKFRGLIMRRLVYMDWLRVLATIAVVTIHVTAGYVSVLDTNNVSRWLAGNFLNPFHVPVFQSS